MLGHATASLHRGPRGWLRRLWGTADIHARQKWAAVWPELDRLPRRGVRLLDAGCGDGAWALEIASRRRSWEIVGIDRDAAAVARGSTDARRLGLVNVSFVCRDFRDARFPSAFDVVLSVASAHYLAADGDGPALFQTFAGWLRPGGMLYLLGPRAAKNPFSIRLPHPTWHDVFSADELVGWCRGAGLDVESLSGRIGRAGITAKQLAWAAGERPLAVQGLVYPIVWLMTLADQTARSSQRQTLMWLLTARRGEAVA